MITLGLYVLGRMLRRPATSLVADSVPYAPILASSTPVAAEVAQEVYIATEIEDQEGAAA